MELFVNGSKLDIQLENEKTVGDVLKSFEEESSKEGIATVNIIVDGKQITADIFDETAKQELKDSTKIELGVVSKEAIKNSFEQQKDAAKSLSEELKTISVKFQSSKDAEANAIIAKLADYIDGICHTASLSMLFPEDFGSIKIDGKTFNEFFADLSSILPDFEQAIKNKDTVLIGDLAEYEISPRLDQLATSLEYI
ncbi:MAG: hypothetical protein K6B73_01970 [Treponema sp.]|nr:hypothetical protein [Treponema sp.]